MSQDPLSVPVETTVPPPIENARHIWSTTDKPADGPSPPAQPTGSDSLSKHLTNLFTLSYLVFFAIFGTLARLGLQALTVYPGAPVMTGVVWANVGGSLLMGFFLEDKNLFREGTHDDKHQTFASKGASMKKSIPLYIGLTTGFCGSFTSFSSFIRDVFLALTNDLANPNISGPIPPRNGGYSFMALLAVILTTLSLSLGALICGAHLALALDALSLTPAVPVRFARRFLDPLFVLLGWGAWLGAIFLAIWPPDRHSTAETWRGRAVFAVVFAPLGCLLRYYVSRALNARTPTFPLGTFAVNIFGTIVLAMCFDLQRVEGIASVLTSCQVLEGVQDGFCGTATTVSTWAAELKGLSRRSAYFYGAASVAVGLGFFVIIVGSLGWTRGFAEPVCLNV